MFTTRRVVGALVLVSVACIALGDERRLAIVNKAVFANQSHSYTLMAGDPAYGRLTSDDGYVLRSGYPAFGKLVWRRTRVVEAGRVYLPDLLCSSAGGGPPLCRVV